MYLFDKDYLDLIFYLWRNKWTHSFESSSSESLQRIIVALYWSKYLIVRFDERRGNCYERKYLLILFIKNQLNTFFKNSSFIFSVEIP